MLKRLVRFDLVSYLQNCYGADTFDSWFRYISDTLEAIKAKYPIALDTYVQGGKVQGLDKRFKGNDKMTEARVVCSGTSEAYNAIIEHWNEFDIYKDVTTTYVDVDFLNL